MADVKSIEWLLTAKDQASPVFRGLESSMDRVSSAHAKLVGMLGGLGGALTVGGFAAMVKGSIDGMNALYELSIKTGVAVETLSALRGVAKQSGTDLESVGGFVQKLTKNMYEFAATGGGKAALAFESMGMSQTQVKAGLTDMNAFLPEFAKRLLETGNGSQQVAMAMQLMGRSGAEALPFLHQLAETGTLNGKVTEEQARQAHEFEVTMVKLNATTTALKNQIAAELLPSLLGIAKAFLEIKNANAAAGAGGGDSVWATVAEGMRMVANSAVAGFTAIKIYAQGIGALFAALNAAKSGNLTGALGVLADFSADAQAQTDQYMQMRARILNPEPASGMPKAAGAGVSLPPAVGAVLARERDERERTARIIAEGEERAAKESAEAWDYWGKIQIENHKQQVEANAAQWKAVFDEIDAEQQRQIDQAEAYLRAEAEVQRAQKTSNTLARDLGLTFTSAFENAIERGMKLRDVIGGLANDIARLIARKTITEPLGQAATDLIKGFDFKGLFGNTAASDGGINSYAVGTDYVPYDQVALIHQGEKIIPAAENAREGGATPVQVNFTVNAMDAQSFHGALYQSRSMIVGIINDAYNKRGQYGPLGR